MRSYTQNPMCWSTQATSSMSSNPRPGPIPPCSKHSTGSTLPASSHKHRSRTGKMNTFCIHFEAHPNSPAELPACLRICVRVQPFTISRICRIITCHDHPNRLPSYFSCLPAAILNSLIMISTNHD